MTEITGTTKTNTLALVDFIAAFVIPLVGLILGILARRQLSTPGNPETGRGLARWAMVIGALGTIFQLAFFIVWLSMLFTLLNGHTIGS
ncbi:hypothetical protein FHX49_001815 [Microbacterium endophyticum]|uniref:DUF4190 domain-containing protein n=1 Tax=Microbacterium endophyticum TaxID=1526412 RepID=A0A7W4YP00_9MICO|nr:DUF4190 domain-containing protein [Microbacterium endophyticum]MBB2976241.1 hypothetical protein [Microbacterium endophyticum]NIK35121.1 hypothetical protein [Microbacterium endophyticum]